MKLFELEIGNIRQFAVAEDMEEMEERKAEVDATFAFLPVQITEVSVEGFIITADPDAQSEGDTPKRRGGRRAKEVAE